MRLRMIVTFLLACAPAHLFAQPAHLVKDIFNLPAAAGSNPQKFAQAGSTIFFAASDTSRKSGFRAASAVTSITHAGPTNRAAGIVSQALYREILARDPVESG